MAGATDLLIRLLVDDTDLDKVEGSGTRFEKFSSGLGVAAGAATGVLVGLGGAAAGAAIAYAGLERANDQLAANLGLTEEQAEVAGEAAANAYSNAFGGSLEEVQATTGGILSSIEGMRDASVEELQAITEQVQTLGDGFELETSRISQVVGQMISTGLASSAQEGLDLLTATLQKVPAQVRADVLDAVDEYGPFFQAVGMSGEEMMSALAAASEKGMYGIDKTGDAVKEFSIRATDMSAASVAAYEAAGLSAEEMAAKVLEGGESSHRAFLMTVDGLLGIEDPVARANAAIALFGTPLEDLGVNEIPTFLDSLADVAGGLGDVSGAAQQMADTAGDNLASSWESVTRTFEMTAAELGESLAPVIMGVLEGLQGFADWASENTELVTVIAVAVGILAAAILVIYGVTQAFAAVQAVQTAAQWANNAAWLASPVTWIILAIIAAIALLVAAGIWLVQNWEGVSAWFGGMWQGLMDGASVAVGWIGDRIGDFVNFFMSIPQRIGDAFGWLGDTLRNIAHSVASAIAWLWNNTFGAIQFSVPDWVPFIGGNTVAFPQLVVPALAAGGIVTGPTLALIGEAGPEAVVPLSQGGQYGLGGNRVTVPIELAVDGVRLLRVLKEVELAEAA